MVAVLYVIIQLIQFPQHWKTLKRQIENFLEGNTVSPVADSGATGTDDDNNNAVNIFNNSNADSNHKNHNTNVDTDDSDQESDFIYVCLIVLLLLLFIEFATIIELLDK